MALAHTQVIKSGWKPYFLTDFAQQSVNLHLFRAKEFKNAVKFDKK